MKRICLSAILMVSAVLMAAQNVMQIPIPKFERLGTLTTEGVNIRKAASATSPRLMELTTEENYQEFHLVWEGSADAKKRGYSCQAFHMEKGGTLVILNEEGEWYKVLISCGDNSYSYDCTVGYIMKKFLNPINTPLPSITQDMLNGSLRTDGKYKGCSVELEIAMDISRMTMGKIVNGNMFVKFCFADETYFSFEEDQPRPLIIEKDEYSQTLKYNKSISTTSEEFGTIIDTSKLSDADITAIFAKELKKPCKYVEIYFYNVHEGRMDNINFFIDEVSKSLPMETVTVE